jgi:hypothetical protein
MENATSVTMNIPGSYSQKVTFHQSKGIGIPPIPGLSADLMERINRTQVKLLPYERSLLKWVGSSQPSIGGFAMPPKFWFVIANPLLFWSGL